MHIILKNLGETPLQAIERFRAEQGIVPGTPMTYAGRLDPLAEGLLIVLVDEECKEKDKYIGLDKIYETDIILGITTDTHDVMGLPRLYNFTDSANSTVAASNQLDKSLQSMVGKFTQAYPPFSSKPITVNGIGRPMFELARSGSLADLDPADLPTKEVEIFSIDLLGEREVGAGELLKDIQSRIGLVKGDFRQEKIAAEWNKILADSKSLPTRFRVINLRAHVSSGVYIRSLANRLNGIALSIYRVKIGKYDRAN